MYEVSSQLLFDNINKDGEKYFPFISVIFTFVLFSNLIGLVPYSFTTTSHLIVTFTLSLSIFIGINIICIQKYKFHMLSLFLPANTSFGLALLLVPIELLSYIFKSKRFRNFFIYYLTFFIMTTHFAAASSNQAESGFDCLLAPLSTLLPLLTPMLSSL